MPPSNYQQPDSETSSNADTPMTDAHDLPPRPHRPSFGHLNPYLDDTPDYTDSDTNPNTTASSVAGDAPHADGRKKRAEALQLRKSILGRKHGQLGESKEDDSIRRFKYLLGLTDLFRS